MTDDLAETYGLTLITYGAYLHLAAAGTDYALAAATALAVHGGRVAAPRLVPHARRARRDAPAYLSAVARTRTVRVAVVGAVGVLCVVAPIAAVTPAVALPVGTAETTGASMGTDAQLIVYVDQPVERGDVVVFDAGEAGYIDHRAVRETSDGWVTKGDAREQPDQPTLPYATEQTVRGVVVFRVDADLLA